MTNFIEIQTQSLVAKKDLNQTKVYINKEFISSIEVLSNGTNRKAIIRMSNGTEYLIEETEISKFK